MIERRIAPVNWQQMWKLLSKANESAPYSEEPMTIGFDDPDERWKEEAQLLGIEEHHQQEVDKLIRDCFEGGEWPDVSLDIGWCIEKRFNFAFDCISRWAGVPRPLVTGVSSDYDLSQPDFLRALLTEYYWKVKFPKTTNS